MEIQSKACRKCGQQKPLSDFYGKARQSKFPASSAGFSSDCKECVKARVRAERKALGEVHKNKMRNWDYKRKFGITLEQYNQMFAEQRGCCSICGLHQSQFKKTFAVDHDHATGVVRSLLCVNCNLGVGCFRDNPALLKAAIRYLERHSTTNTESAQVVSDKGENGGLTGQNPVH